MTLPSDTTRKVAARVTKSTDLELHIGRLETPFGNYVEIRDFVPSRKIYGRGVLIPDRILDDVTDAIDSLALGLDPGDDDDEVEVGSEGVPQ